jgi:hypothetical protein
MYIGMTRCIAELSVRADPEIDSTPGDYLDQRMAVHEGLVAAIRLGDEEQARAAIAAHRGEAAAQAGAEAALPAATAGDGERIASLERENQELRRTNAILMSASALFAAELDRPSR